MTVSVPIGVRYRVLPPDRSADDLEREVLARWTDEQLFERTQETAAGRPEFVFFEGPPTANGKPGIHHVFARTVKDLFCRHRAMRFMDAVVCIEDISADRPGRKLRPGREPDLIFT